MTLQERQDLAIGIPPSGMPAALAALVLALEERGALSRERYRDILVSLWTAMPEDAAFDREAQTCERLVEFLDGLPSQCRGMGGVAAAKREGPVTKNSAVP